MSNIQRGCRLFEADFSGIEAVLSGYFMRAPEYIWLAKLGVHAGLASHILKRPYDPSWGTDAVAAYFKEIKNSEPVVYDRSKRCVHGKNYGLTIHGMVRNFPETYPTLTVAKKFEAVYNEMAPELPRWHADIRTVAYELNYLGGASKPAAYPNNVAQVFARNPHLTHHPYGYKHWFWSVLGFRGIPFHVYQKRQAAHEPVVTIQGKFYAVIMGDDAKRAVAFFPQSTAAAILKEVMLRLFDPDSPAYIGDAYYGRTPFRAPIHDSLLLEIPIRVWDKVVEHVYREMLRPIPELSLDWVPAADRQRLGMGTLLSIGVAGKAGMDWKHMDNLPNPTLEELGVAVDGTFFVHEDADEEDEESLGTVA